MAASRTAYAREYRRKHRDHINAQRRGRSALRAEDISTRDKASHRADPRKEMVFSARKRAKRCDVPFSLSPQDFSVPEVCPIFGLPLSVGDGKLHDFSPTLDRIVPQLGYVPGNVWVISYKANRAKNNCTLAELKALVAALELTTAVL